MLEPLESANKSKYTEIQRICEICKKETPSSLALSFKLIIPTIGIPGKAATACPFEQHWACSIEHWALAAHACINEHGQQILLAMHTEKG